MWKLASSTNDLRTKYGITCPVDASTSTDTVATGTRTLIFASWDFPWYLGAITAPGLADVGFIWTDKKGWPNIYSI